MSVSASRSRITISPIASIETKMMIANTYGAHFFFASISGWLCLDFPSVVIVDAAATAATAAVAIDSTRIPLTRFIFSFLFRSALYSVNHVYFVPKFSYGDQ